MADLDRTLELVPDATPAVATRGLTYLLMGRYDEALADLTRIVELNPDDASALSRRGETYRLMGRYHEALADHNEPSNSTPSRG